MHFWGFKCGWSNICDRKEKVHMVTRAQNGTLVTSSTIEMVPNKSQKTYQEKNNLIKKL